MRGVGAGHMPELLPYPSAGSPSRAEIHLDRLAANVRDLKNYVGSSVGLIAVVKADAYGHGAPPVARVALEAGADQLAVYTLAEALALRAAGLTAPILVLGPIFVEDARAVVESAISPALTTVESAFAIAACALAQGTEVGYHLEVDTGLKRNGLFPDEVLPFVETLARFPGLRREGVFTHFASADEEDKTPTTHQAHVFESVVRALTARGLDFPLRHVANSAATLDAPALHFNAVRIGIALYGYYPSAAVARAVSLSPILTVGSRLARVSTVPAGTGVGYGYEYRTGRESRIGLVPFGYGDGYPRNVQGKAHVLVRGKRAPVLGRIAMDQCAIDLTDIADATQADQVVIMGRDGDEEITAEDIADWSGTISYEILTRITGRVPRWYVSAGTVEYIRQPFATPAAACTADAVTDAGCA